MRQNRHYLFYTSCLEDCGVLTGVGVDVFNFFVVVPGVFKQETGAESKNVTTLISGTYCAMYMFDFFHFCHIFANPLSVVRGPQLGKSCATAVVFNGESASSGRHQLISRGREPSRPLQHGKFLNGKVFRPIYLFKDRGCLKQSTIT